jgi:hypothetical protein
MLCRNAVTLPVRTQLQVTLQAGDSTIPGRAKMETIATGQANVGNGIESASMPPDSFSAARSSGSMCLAHKGAGFREKQPSIFVFNFGCQVPKYPIGSSGRRVARIST